MDALKLSVEVDLKELPNLLKRVFKVYSDEAYKKGPFAWVDHIGEVKDKNIYGILDTKVIERINGDNFKDIWLSVPEIIDWDLVVGFKYSNAKSSTRYYDIRISDFVKTLKDGSVDIKRPNQRKILCVYSDDNIVYQKPVYRFIYTEVIYQSDCIHTEQW